MGIAFRHLLVFALIVLLAYGAQSADAQAVPSAILRALEASNAHVEPDGLTKWEKRSDGTIVKYHFGRDEVHKVYHPDGRRQVFGLEGGLILDERADASSVLYSEETGEIETILKEGQIVHYEDGQRVKIEEPGSGADGDLVAVMTAKNAYRIREKGTIFFIETDDEQRVRSARHSTNFQKDFEVHIAENDDGSTVETRRLLDPVTGETNWERTVTSRNGKKIATDTVSMGLKHSLQALWIRWFGKSFSLEDAQALFDEHFTE